MYYEHFSARLAHALRRADTAASEVERNAHREMAAIYAELIRARPPEVEEGFRPVRARPRRG